MATSGADIEAARDDAVARLLAAQAGAETEFPRADLDLIGPDGMPRFTDPDMLAEALAASRGADLRAGRTLVGPHRADMLAVYGDKGVEAKTASTGEQKALLISLVLANARALSETGQAPVVLLDEVAAHLDQDRRAALFAEIEGLGVQAWMTGTGPELFEAVGGGCLKLSVSDTGDGSIVEAA